MIQDAATAGLLSKQPLVTRLDAIVEAATAVYLGSARWRGRSPQPVVTASPWQQQMKGTMAQPSRIQQCQRLNRGALPLRTMMTTQNSPLSHPVKSRLSAAQLRVLFWQYYSVENQFERFRVFLELISRFEFEFQCRENYIF